MQMKQADFARLLDLSRNTITQWKKRGTLVLKGNLVDIEPTLSRIADLKRDGEAFVTLARRKLADAVTDNQGDKVTAESDAAVPLGPPPGQAKLGVVHGLEALRGLPATAAEIAGRHGVFDVTAFYDELVGATVKEIGLALADNGLTRSDLIHICDGEEAFMPPSDFRRPRETEDAMWDRIFAAEGG